MLELARAAVARHGVVGDIDGGGLLAHAREVVGLAAREVLDGTVDDLDLRDSVAGWHRLEAGVAAEKLRRLRELADRDAWAGAAMSPHGWATEALGLTRGEARTLVDTALALRRLPQVERQLAAGEIGIGHAIETARSLGEVDRVQAARERLQAGESAALATGTAVPGPGGPAGGEGSAAAEQDGHSGLAVRHDTGAETGTGDQEPDGHAAGGHADGKAEDVASVLDRLAAGEGPGADRRQLRRALDAEADRRAGVLAARERRMRTRRRVWVGRRGSDGMGAIEGDLTPMAMVKAQKVLLALAGQRTAGDTRSFAQRKHDALEQVFDWALAAAPLPDQAGEQPRVLLTVEAGALHDVPGTPRAVLDGYGEVCNETARQICCDVEVTAVAQGDGRDVLNVGQDRRQTNRAQRRAVFARDQGCVGCGAPLSLCQIHHVLWPWHERGRTDIAFLVAVCWDCPTRQDPPLRVAGPSARGR